MSQAFYSLALLACPLGLGAMMWMMMRGTKKDAGQQTGASTAAGGTDAELARLRAEVDQLQAAQRDRSEPRVQDSL